MKKKERKKSTFWKDFKAFISRGNIVDLAVGLVVGAAFTAIVNSLVNDIIKPLIALLVDGDFSELVVVLRQAVYDTDGVTVLQEAITLNYGNLIMAILTFLIDAFVIFTVLRIVRSAQRRMKESGEKLKEKLARKGEAAEAAEKAAEETVEAVSAPEPVSSKPTAEELLAEIRDLLRAQSTMSEPSGPEEKKAE